MQSIKGGQSGAFIFITEDRKYAIKTITEDELRLMITILPEYADRLINHQTYLVKIIGIFTIYPENVHIVIMTNLFPLRDHMIVFDLKGSIANRKIFFEGFPPSGGTLKDQNFLEMGVKIQSPRKEEIISCLEGDFRLLEKFDIMDYSLIVGIPIHELRESNIIQMSDSVVIGIIDILQKYNLKKKYEKKIKSLLTNPEKLSVLDSPSYLKRISKFIREIFINQDN